MECSICFESANASTGFTQLACSHTFHLKCIVTWLSKTSSCPCCRAEPNENETVQAAVALKSELDEVTADYNRLASRIRYSKVAVSIMRDEKNRLEKLVVDAMTGKEKELFLFSKELERVIPSLFKNIVYADDGQGNEVIFHAFLPQRLRMAQEAADTNWAPLYAAFTSGMLLAYHRVVRDAAEEGKVWQEYYDPKTGIEPRTIIE